VAVEAVDEAGQAHAGESVSTPEIRERRLRRRIAQLHVAQFALTSMLLAAGLGLLWLTKSILEINGDAIFIALLLVPVIVYLATTDQLSKFSAFGASLEFKKHVDGLTKDVTEHVTNAENELAQLEPRRTAFLGKLNQVLRKERDWFSLVYADVDHLRKETGAIYQEKRLEGKRMTEEDIRDDIIRDLELALLDGFYNLSVEGAKCDIFRLEDPDVAMIVRGVTPGQAKEIAQQALDSFSRSHRTATCAVFTPARQHELTPKELDGEAAKALETAKKGPRGRMHDA
jgi:GGDEF domain-containing protein